MIQKLCHPDVNHRLVEPALIKNEPFFNVDWSAVQRRLYTPPFIPKVCHASCCTWCITVTAIRLPCVMPSTTNTHSHSQFSLSCSRSYALPNARPSHNSQLEALGDDRHFDKYPDTGGFRVVAMDPKYGGFEGF